MTKPLPTPLVSEYDIQNLWDDRIRPLVKKLERELGPGSVAWQAGEMGRHIVAIYEAERSVLLREVEELKGKYNELVFAVATKHEGEDRHHTALRYIMEREARSGDGRTCSATPPDPNN